MLENYLIEMIKNIIKILVILLIFYSCKEERSLNTRQLISDFKLESYGNYINGKPQKNKWFSKDSTLTFTLYHNYKTKHFLYIVQNNNKDTVFKFFDRTNMELRVRNFIKVKNNYFVTLWHPSLKKYIGFEAGHNEKRYTKDLYTYDSLNIYKIDTLSYQLTKIEKPSIENIKETIKGKDSFKVIKSNSKIRLIKDTLYNQKILYEYDVELEIKKNNEKYSLEPYFFNKSKRELDENNLSSYSYPFLTDKNLKGEIKYYYRFDNEYNTTGYSKIDFVFHQSRKKYIIQTSLDNLFILDEEYKRKNIDSLTTLRIEPFKYINSEYYFLLTQESLEYWDGIFPMIYHIDIQNLKIERLLPIETIDNKKGKKLKKYQEIENLSTIYKSILNSLLRDFEIVKVKDEYRLIKKNK